MEGGGREREGRRGGVDVDLELDLDSEANGEAWGALDGFPNDSAQRPAMLMHPRGP